MKGWLIKVLGAERFNAKLRAYEKKKKGAVRKALILTALRLQRFSMQIVPIDKGILRASARTQLKTNAGNVYEAWVTYGTNYAIYVHEDMNARHAEGKTAKFLERPIRENRAELIATFRAAVKNDP